MVLTPTNVLDTNPVPPPPITQTLFKDTHPAVIEKDKSIHSEHGVIRYPFYYGGLASVVSGFCTQPLGVGKRRLSGSIDTIADICTSRRQCRHIFILISPALMTTSVKITNTASRWSTNVDDEDLQRNLAKRKVPWIVERCKSQRESHMRQLTDSEIAYSISDSKSRLLWGSFRDV